MTKQKQVTQTNKKELGHTIKLLPSSAISIMSFLARQHIQPLKLPGDEQYPPKTPQRARKR
jgi:hypothetical protein